MSTADSFTRSPDQLPLSPQRSGERGPGGEGSPPADQLLRELTETLVAGGLETAAGRHEARLLLLAATGLTPEALRMEPTRAITPTVAAQARAWGVRRAAREPLAYVLGTRDFYGLRFVVTPAVLIPRPETEFVVEAVLDHLAAQATDASAGTRVVDVGTGSGAIAIAVALHAPSAQVWATDVSEAALEIARRNAQALGVADRVQFALGDLLAPIRAIAPFAAIASNPPYIAPAEIDMLEPEVRDWEPRVALGTRSDPLHFYQRLAMEAPSLLLPGGLLTVEVGQGQADAVVALWRGAGLKTSRSGTTTPTSGASSAGARQIIGRTDRIVK